MKQKVLVTGARGFIGLNLVQQLHDQRDFEVIEVHRSSSHSEIERGLMTCDIVVHLAGANRPQRVQSFDEDNVSYTRDLLTTLDQNSPKPLIFSSSTQASLDNPYGRSKSACEQLINEYSRKTQVAVRILRLPNVFGKWSRPHYNSVVATFIHDTLRGENVRVVEPEKVLELLYIDDLVEALITDIRTRCSSALAPEMPTYRVTVQELFTLVSEIHTKRRIGQVLDVGSGLLRALYATYVSALQPHDFTYPLSPKCDNRGSFVEILKTPSAGQFSSFVAKPGATRGSHFHHSKVEKFLVVAGTARFRFKQLNSKQQFETVVSAESPMIVESIPGWIHDVTNIGNHDVVVVVWANEVYREERPDTYVGATT